MPDLEDEAFIFAWEKFREDEWLEAAVLFEKALDSARLGDSYDKLLSIVEPLGAAYYRAAFQSDTREGFVGRMERARNFFEETMRIWLSRGSGLRASRFKAKALFASFWLEENSDRRRKIIQDCISVAESVAIADSAKAEEVDVARAGTDLLTYSREALQLDKDWENRLREFQRAYDLGPKIVELLEHNGNQEELVSALHDLLWIISVDAEGLLEPPKFRELEKYAMALCEKLSLESRKVDKPLTICFAKEAAADIAWDFQSDTSKALNLYLEALEAARNAQDRFAIGRLLAVIAGLQHWRAASQDFAAERGEIIEQGLSFGEEAAECLKVPAHNFYLARTYAFQAACYIDRANLVETDWREKSVLLRKAIDVSSNGLLETGTDGWYSSAHEKAKALVFLAMGTSGHADRKRLLEEALLLRLETVRIVDTLQPHSWNRGVMRNYLALIKSELAKVEQDPQAKTRLLEESVSDMKQCLHYCGEWSSFVPGSALRLARYNEWFGDILLQLYQMKPEGAISENAAAAYVRAVECIKQTAQIGSLPPVRWKIAKLYDLVGDFGKASDAFRTAGDDYALAARSVQGASSTFEELAVYMGVWDEIENARLLHSSEEYSLASESFSRAAEKVRDAKPWGYLSTILVSRSMLEISEKFGQEENQEAAVKYLRSALEGFRSGKRELDARLRAGATVSEEQELNDWLHHTTKREAYCIGRIEVEEAKIADRKGQKAVSSRKYISASANFRRLAEQTSSLPDREELTFLAQFCESWSKMKAAESNLSPELFGSAAESFTKIGETVTKQTLRLLAFGNSSICRALESGTRFRFTRDPEFYSEIKRHLETAADYYAEGGFRKTGNWTRATQRLFDALLFSVEAETERDPTKKTELLHLAETQFDLAAKLYGEAGFPGKRDEILEERQRTREQKEALLAALEALARVPLAPTLPFSSIPRTGSSPPGLGRFEDANLAGEIVGPPETAEALDFTIKLDLVNIGRTPATLIKLEHVVPQGLQPAHKDNQLLLQGSSLDLKGKRLEYLRTHQVEFSLRGDRPGTFDFAPKVIYVDEKGNYRSYEFRPLLLTVREPGVSERMGPPPVVTLPSEFQFEDERSREVFRHLIKVFLEDHMSKRIVEEKAGWRTMMDVIEDLRIARSALYGPEKRTGPVLRELQHRGLVETRVFPGERGRGGDIKKIRIAFENAIVKRIVERAVLQDTKGTS